MIAALRCFRSWRAGTGDEGQFQAAGINKHLKPLLGTLAQLGFRLAPGVACLKRPCDERNESAFDPEAERRPTALVRIFIGGAPMLHSAFRPRSRTASRIFAIRRFTAGKVCFGSNVTALDLGKRVLKGLAMLLEPAVAGVRVFHASHDGMASGATR